MIRKVKVRDIKPNPFNVRKTNDPEAIKSLAEEIKKVGLWAGALRGREHNGHVELCFGHRRLEAIKQIGWKEVEIDLVNLSDEEMALQALVENLQREGLNDADKGEGIAAYISLREESGIRDRSRIMDEISSILGYSVRRLQEFIEVAGFSDKVKEKVRSGKIAGSTAVDAARVGGEGFVNVAAEKELPRQTVQAIGQQLRAIASPEVKEKVRAQVVKGELTTPEEVVKKARQLEGRQKRGSAPPDLLLVIGNWTIEIRQWIRYLDEAVKPEALAYIDTEPHIAEKFRAQVRELIARLQKFL